MAELTAAAGVRGGREWSPDSVIFALESNLSSLFSSASASVGRCSAASDPHDADSLSSAFSPHLAGHESGGPDLDLPSSSNKSLVLSSYRGKKVEKAKVEREEDNNRVALHLDGDDFQALGSHSARNSFSIALKECQERRSKSEALINKLERRRPASLDLNSSLANVVSSSPRLGPMKKTETSATATTAVSCRKSGNFPSPGTPNYHHGSVGINKGWSSERVPLPNNGNRRQMGASLLPLHNGRTLPSKWEDAERWIFSPVAGDGVGRPSYQQPQRRPKSKSGPLGPPGMAYYSLYSPAFPIYSGGNVNNITGGSPFSAGVMVADESSVHAEGGLGQSFASVMDSCIARSASVHGCTDLVVQSSLTSSNDDKVDGVKDAATEVSPVVSKRDMATQMSHNCPRSSSRRRPSFPPSSSSILPIVEVQSFSSPKSQVRDVEIDERVTVTRWPMKDRARNTASGSEDVDNWKLQAEEPRSSAWEVSETVKSISKVKREEAKIAAWENLQKAKAEAAIRKLEMKLEKKRSSSLDKIMKKLRSAQKKAQEMRSVVSANQSKQACKSSSRAISFRRTRQMGSLSGCFTCHAF